ncbi:MAG TPA: type II toxin-antitoxin system VapB family antitoxin [Candidatus Sulfomarinibacteraceae bacterium]|nr:type II toxin-antitoxin system VapB family antitoxin [Candidatus Sulfomarinibacteraceae bacterium]
MSLNIKNPETYRLVKELADETGQSMTAAVTEAVRERLERLRASAADSEAEIEARVQRMEAIAAVIREHSPPGYWDQDFDELLYDDLGLPK